MTRGQRIVCADGPIVRWSDGTLARDTESVHHAAPALPGDILAIFSSSYLAYKITTAHARHIYHFHPYHRRHYQYDSMRVSELQLYLTRMKEKQIITLLEALMLRRTATVCIDDTKLHHVYSGVLTVGLLIFNTTILYSSGILIFQQ